MWRSVPRALYVGYAIPIALVVASILSWLVTERQTWLQLSVVQVATSATATLMIAIGAFQVARAHTGWRAIAAQVAGAVALFQLVVGAAGLVIFTFLKPLGTAFTSIAVAAIGYGNSAGVIIVAAALAVTSRRLTLGLVAAAVGLAFLQHPPPALQSLFYGRTSSDWLTLALVLSPLAGALVQLGAVGDGLRGKRLGLRRVRSAVRGSGLAGVATWAAAVAAAIAGVVMQLVSWDSGALVLGVAGAVISIVLVVAASAVGRAHHEAISSLLVNIALAGACAAVIALAYLLALSVAVAGKLQSAIAMRGVSESRPLDAMPFAALGGGLALACLGFALWRYARHRHATRLAHSLASRLAAFVVVPAVAFAVGRDEPAIVIGAIALASAMLAGGFFAAARELEGDIVDSTAAVFA